MSEKPTTEELIKSLRERGDYLSRDFAEFFIEHQAADRLQAYQQLVEELTETLEDAATCPKQELSKYSYANAKCIKVITDFQEKK